MSDVSSIKEQNHSCKLTFLLNKDKGKIFIVDFDYNFLMVNNLFPKKAVPLQRQTKNNKQYEY